MVVLVVQELAKDDGKEIKLVAESQEVHLSSSLCTKVAKLGSRSQQSWRRGRESNCWKVAEVTTVNHGLISHIKFAFRKDWEFLFSRIKYRKQENGRILLNFSFSTKRFLCLYGHQILVFLKYNRIHPSTCVYPLSYISHWKRNLFPSNKAPWFRD